MKREDRAKQFLPFDAMKGLAAAMKRQEELCERVERIDLGEEDAAALSDALCHVARGDEVEVTYFRDGTYPTLRGKVTSFDEVKRILSVEDRPIPFDDIVVLSSLPKDP